MARALPVILALGLAACGDDGGGSAPAEPMAEPLSLHERLRLATVDFGDSQAIAQLGGVEPDEIQAEFETGLLARQLWDEPFMRSGADGPAAEFRRRVEALHAEADGLGLARFVVAMDLLRLDGSKVFCDEGQFLSTRCVWTNQFLREEANEQVHQVAGLLGPALLVVGRGMNRIAASKPEEYRAFVEWFGGPVLASGVQGVPASTSIDWERLRADAEARARADAGSFDDALAAVWEEQFAELASGWAMVAIDSRPRSGDPADLPDDYYLCLADLVPENKPVAFTSLSWPTHSPDDSADAVAFLKRFRTLVSGLNVSWVAWDRLVDVPDDDCPVLTGLGLPADRCVSGLIKATGVKKSSWDEFVTDRRSQ